MVNARGLVHPARRRAVAPPQLSRWTSALLLLVAGANISVWGTLTLGICLAVPLLPVILNSSRRDKLVQGVILGVLLCVVAGLVISELNDVNQSSVRVAGAYLFAVLNSLTCLLAFSWSKGMRNFAASVSIFAVGWLGGLPLNHSAWASNPWKFGFSIPVSILLICLVRRRPSWQQAVVLVALACVGFAFSSRSFAGICLATALIGCTRVGRVIFQRARGASGFQFGAFAVAMAVTYYIGAKLALSGFFGADVAERTASQANSPGGLLLSGRPEGLASYALFTNRPMGYGLGAVPTTDDIARASLELSKIGINAETNSYFQTYTFQGEFRLHSLLADFWINFGIVGAVAMAWCGLACFRLMRLCASDGTMRALCIFLSVNTLWFIAFGPTYTNLVEVSLVLAAYASLKAGGPGVKNASS